MLDCSLLILDLCRLPAHQRGDPVPVVRRLTAMARDQITLFSLVIFHSSFNLVYKIGIARHLVTRPVYVKVFLVISIFEACLVSVLCVLCGRRSSQPHSIMTTFVIYFRAMDWGRNELEGYCKTIALGMTMMNFVFLLYTTHPSPELCKIRTQDQTFVLIKHTFYCVFVINPI